MELQEPRRPAVAIVEAAIDIPGTIAAVGDPAAGGIDVFIGTTRNHHEGRKVLRLEYEAYAPMALEEMKKIAARAMERWPLLGSALVHRIGMVAIGEASVVVACSAPHRAEAFEACRFMIDALKRDVPIWKKEYFADGAAWSGPVPSPADPFKAP